MRTVSVIRAIMLFGCLLLSAATCAAGPVQIPGFYGAVTVPAKLPVLKTPGVPVPGISSFDSTSVQNKLTIRQTQPKVIIDWKTFDIDQDSWVHFDQQGNKHWSALNRVWDASPSKIFGRLSADGKIYLINQNGIIFGRTSQVNVNSLVASALNIRNVDFLEGVNRFYREAGTTTDDFLDREKTLPYSYAGFPAYPANAAISHYGTTGTTDGGSVFMIAPRVENYGTITAPLGQVALAAGTEIELRAPTSADSRRFPYVIVKNAYTDRPDISFGSVINRETGSLIADGGLVGMYGNTVDHWGAIRAMTAYRNQKGEVELRAVQKIATAAKSTVTLPVDNAVDVETGMVRTVSDTFDIQPKVNIEGLQKETTPNTFIVLNPVKQIEHNGLITAPTGLVSLKAQERVFLGAGSGIDVSGVVLTLPVPTISLKLNSVELADAYGQKDGLLRGTSIATTLLAGSSIGDITMAILARDRTAMERSIGGAYAKGGSGWYRQAGRVDLTSTDGDIIMKQGSRIDLSGGGINYVGGWVETTKLLSGGKVYDISSAPLALTYDKIIGFFSKSYERYGQKDTFVGTYYGGAAPLKTYVPPHFKGGDAGTLTLSAKTVVLDGEINAGVQRGVFQNTVTMPGSYKTDQEFQVAQALSAARGLEAPRAGTLQVGSTASRGDNEAAFLQQTHAMSVVADTSPRSDLTPESSTIKGQPTILSARMLNNAKLGSLQLNAVTTLETAPDARISLQPGGSFSATARRIEHHGGISVPAGSITLSTTQNATNSESSPVLHFPLQERIVLASGSSLNAAGEIVNNFRTSGFQTTGLTGGGAISIRDMTERGDGVFLQTGSVVDVGGGYSIDRQGKVSGGHAGMLALQGANVQLDGDLRGHALADANGKILGGSLTLTTKDIRVVPVGSGASRVSDGKLLLAADRFDTTGFTQIALRSVHDLIFEPGASLAPSLMRLNNPRSMMPLGAAAPAKYTKLPDAFAYRAGPTSVSAEAGATFDGSHPDYQGNLSGIADIAAKIELAPGASVSTAPAVSSVTRIAADVAAGAKAVKTGITLKGPSVDIGGTVLSRGGEITAAATLNNLVVRSGARLSAAGYNRPDPSSAQRGYRMNYLPVAGGSVSLSADAGDLMLERGSLVDVSGSAPVTSRMRAADGSMMYFTDAGAPGSLTLSYLNMLRLEGEITAQPKLSGIQGGTLTIRRTNELSGMAVSGDDIRRYQAMGFDDLTLRSRRSLDFSGSVDAALGRKLTLDAPEMRGTRGASVALSAPWVVLTNSFIRPTAPAPAAGPASISLSGHWLDVIGSIQFGGFGDVRLSAARDVSLSQALYQYTGKIDETSGSLQPGKLSTTGNLTLQADRVYAGGFYWYKDGTATLYPTLYADYTLQADGKVTILPSAVRTGGPIYSAGGSLTVEAGRGIEHRGSLAAPLGSITLKSPGQRVYLAPGSLLSVAGSTYNGQDLPVEYFVMNENKLWRVEEKQRPGADNPQITATVPVTAAVLPERKVTIDAAETIAAAGSVIDVSGGGSVFARRFEQGVEGSQNPLAKSGRYLVFKENMFQMPGKTVWLQGGGGLSAGMYTILPLDEKNPQNARFAFLPGAYILDTQSGSTLPGLNAFTKEGYPLVFGYASVADTELRSPRPQLYSVRSASDVLKDGHFELQTLTAGDAGSVMLKGSTTVVAGEIRALPRDGFSNGTLSLIGANITLQKGAAASLPADFGFDTPIPDAVKGTLTASADALSGKGFRLISLGDTSTTDTVTIKADTQLEAGGIAIAAKKTITLEERSQLHATTGKDRKSGEGMLTISVPNDPGTLDLKTGSVLHATHAMSIDADDVKDGGGTIRVDDGGDLSLRSRAIVFGDTAKMNNEKGLYVNPVLRTLFTRLRDVSLISKSDFEFRSDTALSSRNRLVLDGARFVNTKAGGAAVTVSAQNVFVQNSAAATGIAAPVAGGSFTAQADSVTVGPGSMAFGGFSSVALNSADDLAFQGAGSLTSGNADLALKGARVTTAAGTDASGTYVVPDFSVDTGTGMLTIERSGATPAGGSRPGGMLAFSARMIDIGGIVDIGSGSLAMKATGSGQNDGIVAKDGSVLRARGNEAATGGRVLLQAATGAINLQSGSLIDVSAGAQGDAGKISLLAPAGGVSLNGTIAGAAQRSGKGGSLALHAKEADLNTLAPLLAAGGMNESLDIRARTGNLTLDAGRTLQARSVRLTAEDMTAGNGQIAVSGTIDGSAGGVGGSVELNAMNNLNVMAGGMVKAASAVAGTSGGTVALNSAQGYVNLNASGTVDVSGGAGGAGGTVTLRAQQTANEVKMNLNGAILGASAVYAEAFRTYTNVATISAANLTTWKTDTTNYMANAANIRNRLLANLSGIAANTFHFLPGIELRNAGNMTLGTNWDLTTGGWRFGGEPVALTLRATGNLYIDNNLVDHPTAKSSLITSPLRDSAAFNLIAGADLNSANVMAVNAAGTEKLVIKDQKLVYSESGPIRFASAGNTEIGQGQNGDASNPTPKYMIHDSMRYNLASYDGMISGAVGNDLIIKGGAIQTATSDIDITVGRDVQLNTANVGSGGDIRFTLGAIRTTGQLSSTGAIGTDPADPSGTPYTKVNGALVTDPSLFSWRYAGGGDIRLDVGRHVGKYADGVWGQAMDANAWDYFMPMLKPGGDKRSATNFFGWFGASYARQKATPLQGSERFFDTTTGLATMGGGNLTVRTGGDFLSQAGTFGEGDLSIQAGRNLDGRFLSRDGSGRMYVAGNLGFRALPTQVELFDSRMAVTVLGAAKLGSVVNPSLASDQLNKSYWTNLTYTPDTSFRLKAGGDVTLTGASSYDGSSTYAYARILPATVDIESASTIFLNGGVPFTLSSSPTGNLRLAAQGDIRSLSAGTPVQVTMSDIAPEDWYGLKNVSGSSWLGARQKNAHGYLTDTLAQAKASPLHALQAADTPEVAALKAQPVKISAGGDIRNLTLYVSKQAEVSAGHDIVNLNYEGQNLAAGDVSSIRAGNDISMPSSKSGVASGFVQGGPGAFLVQAGGSIDLGSANDFTNTDGTTFFGGIQTIGYAYNPLLGTEGSRLILIAGYRFDTTPDKVSALFDTVRNAGDEYSSLMADGRKGEASALLEKTRSATIDPFLGKPSGRGDINMVSSQIGSLLGASDIFIVTAGSMNLGKTTLPNAAVVSPPSTGIWTAGGGAINILAKQDVNVFESRIMTFRGGDITIWSDRGNINAGRGAKSAVSVKSPVKRARPDGGFDTIPTPSSVGSGIRAVTSGENPPPPGNIHLFAPEGIIDAGEAGIAGGKVFIGALKVENAANISSVTGSIGVPKAAEGAVNIAGLSGASLAAQTNPLADSAAVGAARDRASQMIDSIMGRWLDVKVIDFVQ